VRAGNDYFDGAAHLQRNDSDLRPYILATSDAKYGDESQQLMQERSYKNLQYPSSDAQSLQQKDGRRQRTQRTSPSPTTAVFKDKDRQRMAQQYHNSIGD